MYTSLQQVFDIVAKHLLTQMKRSERPGNYVGSNQDDEVPFCAYRASDGSKCAIGCLIPDDIYNPDWEGHCVGTLLSCKPLFRKLFAPRSDSDQDLTEPWYAFLLGLQIIHDTSLPEEWEYDLERFAERFKLTMPEIV